MNQKWKIAAFVAVILLIAAAATQGFNFRKRLGGKNPVGKAKTIKRNLEQDVRNLRADARALIRSKNSLIRLKQKINSELRQVENTLKKTENDIKTTSRHVREIDSLIRMFR